MSEESGKGCGCLFFIIIIIGISYFSNNHGNNANKNNTNNTIQNIKLSTEKKLNMPILLDPLKEKLYNNWSGCEHVSQFEYLDDLTKLVNAGFDLQGAKSKEDIKKYDTTLIYYMDPTAYILMKKMEKTSLSEFKSRVRSADIDLSDQEIEGFYDLIKEISTIGIDEYVSRGNYVGLAMQTSAIGKNYLENAVLLSEQALTPEQLNPPRSEDYENKLYYLEYFCGLSHEQCTPQKGYVLNFNDGKKINAYYIDNRWAFSTSE